jgi:RNA polymerase sigma-70 factor (ECF subfamily)
METMAMKQYRAQTRTHNDPRESSARYLPLDRRSAARFLDDYEPLVTGVLARMRVREPDEAMSRIFQKALKALPNFRGESRLSTWLYRIAWREGLSQIQRQARQDQREAPLEAALDRMDSAEDQLQTLERLETAASVRAALGRLPVRDREVLALRFLEELPFAQVGERLDISESAAKVRSHRALTRLRLVLEDCHE